MSINAAGRISRRTFVKVASGSAVSLAVAEALTALGCTGKSNAPAKATSAATQPSAPASAPQIATSTATTSRPAGTTGAAAASKGLTVTFVAQQMSAESNQRSLKGFQDYLKGKNLSWNVTVTDAKGDPGTLSNMVTDAATRKVDAIVIAFGTLTAAQGALKAVADAKIPLFTLDSGYYPPSICDIASNNYDIGGKMSEYMVQRLLAEGKTNANICTVIANFHHGTRKRGKVLEAVLSENQWIKSLDSRVIQYEGFFETTLNTVRDWLTRFGDKIDAIWCPWDEPATAAAQAIVNSGRDVKSMFVVGADGHPPAVDQMRSNANWPLVATVAQAFELWGAVAAYFIEQIVAAGKPARDVVPIPVIDLPSPLIVKGINLPEQGKMPWQATDLYDLIEKQAISSAG